MPPADWPTDLLPPVPARQPAPRPPLSERVRAAAETVMWAGGVVAMLALDAILIVVFLAVWKAR
jgi:hypothetical protein